MRPLVPEAQQQTAFLPAAIADSFERTQQGPLDLCLANAPHKTRGFAVVSASERPSYLRLLLIVCSHVQESASGWTITFWVPVLAAVLAAFQKDFWWRT